MGDRISIQFEKNGNRSVALFSHWGGVEFLGTAVKYAADLKKENSNLEPETAMVDFIHLITAGEKRITHGLRLGMDEYDGDNSDNGNHIISLDK